MTEARVQRRASRLTLAVIAAASLFPFDAATAEDGALRKAIAARYAELDKAEAARDGGAIGAIFAPSFVSVDVDGKARSAAEVVVEEVTAPPNPTQTVTGAMLGLRRVGDGVRVEMRTEIAWFEADAHRFTLVTRTSDGWVKQDGAWRMARTAVDDFTFSRDGRQLDHRTRK